ncbi:MAG: hypothetical protein ACOX8Q_00515 [Christensenellales bacterium]|jgi:hypothetical protein
MNFKSALKYQLYGMRRPLIVFYIVIYSLIILIAIMRAVLDRNNVNALTSGLEMASIIFIFITGLNSFRSPFHMFLANGVSRQTMFKSFAAAVVPVAAGMALLDSINSKVLSSIVNYRSMYFVIYQNRYDGPLAQAFFEGLLWMFFCYIAAAMVGFFITTLYYRMSKPTKLVVSIGVPVLFLFILPYIDGIFLNSVIFRLIGTIFAKAGGFLDGFNPYISMVSNIIIYGGFGALSFLLMRKATVKES